VWFFPAKVNKLDWHGGDGSKRNGSAEHIFRQSPRRLPLLINQAKALWESDLPLSSNLANISALLKQCLDRTNWVGFYLWDDRGAQLVVGPFQGLPACTRIALGKGVCGTAASTGKTQLVADVHAFPGHIACDSASQSEIVVPIIRNGQVLGVLDIDSPERARFDATDQAWLERLVAALISLWPAV
jgi:L-methionine (R)-S-oxide reductase